MNSLDQKIVKQFKTTKRMEGRIKGYAKYFGLTQADAINTILNERLVEFEKQLKEEQRVIQKLFELGFDVETIEKGTANASEKPRAS